jgi:hypothetical protein
LKIPKGKSSFKSKQDRKYNGQQKKTKGQDWLSCFDLQLDFPFGVFKHFLRQKNMRLLQVYSGVRVAQSLTLRVRISFIHSKQHFVIKFVSDFREIYSTNTDRHDITEILLNVALNTITLTPL